MGEKAKAIGPVDGAVAIGSRKMRGQMGPRKIGMNHPMGKAIGSNLGSNLGSRMEMLRAVNGTRVVAKTVAKASPKAKAKAAAKGKKVGHRKGGREGATAPLGGGAGPQQPLVPLALQVPQEPLCKGVPPLPISGLLAQAC